MTSPRLLTVVHTRPPRDEWDEWHVWQTNSDCAALFHAGGAASGRLVEVTDVLRACSDAGVPDLDRIDVCIARGTEPDQVWDVMNAMLAAAPGRPVHVALHNLETERETALAALVHLEFGREPDLRGIYVYSLGEGTVRSANCALIAEYVTSIGTEEYEGALTRLNQFLLDNRVYPAPG